MSDDKKELYDKLNILFNQIKEACAPSLEDFPVEAKTFFVINERKGYEGFSIELLKKLKIISDIREVMFSQGLVPRYVNRDEWYLLGKDIDTFKILNFSYEDLIKLLEAVRKFMYESQGRRR